MLLIELKIFFFFFLVETFVNFRAIFAPLPNGQAERGAVNKNKGETHTELLCSS